MGTLGSALQTADSAKAQHLSPSTEPRMPSTVPLSAAGSRRQLPGRRKGDAARGAGRGPRAPPHKCAKGGCSWDSSCHPLSAQATQACADPPQPDLKLRSKSLPSGNPSPGEEAEAQRGHPTLRQGSHRAPGPPAGPKAWGQQQPGAHQDGEPLARVHHLCGVHTSRGQYQASSS